jgi:hypothetical protein
MGWIAKEKDFPSIIEWVRDFVNHTITTIFQPVTMHFEKSAIMAGAIRSKTHNLMQ